MSEPAASATTTRIILRDIIDDSVSGWCSPFTSLHTRIYPVLRAGLGCMLQYCHARANEECLLARKAKAFGDRRGAFSTTLSGANSRSIHVILVLLSWLNRRRLRILMAPPDVMYHGTAPPVQWYSCAVLQYNCLLLARASVRGLIWNMRHRKAFELALRGARELRSGRGRATMSLTE